MPAEAGTLEGQTLLEYAMILLCIAVASVVSLTLLRLPVIGFYNALNGSF